MQLTSSMARRALGIACLALCAAGALALARGVGRFSAGSAALDPVGVWSVIDYTATDPATGAVTRPFGRQLLGSAIYTRGGHLSVLVAGSERAGEPGGAAARKGSSAAAGSVTARAALRAQWLDSMYAYTGTYTLAGDALTVHIESAWQPSWVGTTKTRTLSLQGGVLTVSTPPMVSPADGRTYISITRFRRAE